MRLINPPDRVVTPQGVGTVEDWTADGRTLWVRLDAATFDRYGYPIGDQTVCVRANEARKED